MMNPYLLARAFFFSMDPERAHELAMAAIDGAAATGALRLVSGAPIDDPVQVMGLQFRNRIGLAAGLVTNDLNRAHRVIHQLQAGICWINTWGESAAEMPVGGYKQSAVGRENGIDTLRAYTRIKSIQVELGAYASVF